MFNHSKPPVRPEAARVPEAQPGLPSPLEPAAHAVVARVTEGAAPVNGLWTAVTHSVRALAAADEEPQEPAGVGAGAGDGEAAAVEAAESAPAAQDDAEAEAKRAREAHRARGRDEEQGGSHKAERLAAAKPEKPKLPKADRQEAPKPPPSKPKPKAARMADRTRVSATAGGTGPVVRVAAVAKVRRDEPDRASGVVRLILTGLTMAGCALATALLIDYAASLRPAEQGSSQGAAVSACPQGNAPCSR